MLPRNANIAEAILDRAEARAEAAKQVKGYHQKAQRNEAGAMAALDRALSSYDRLDPFTDDPADPEVGVPMLKDKARHIQAQQEALAALTSQDGDLGGYRESLMLDYENRLDELAKTIRRIAEDN